ncbi:MAG: ABC transporter permease [Clostridia bacterium]|nr:ABC transporter permease [Clostridia bacterium]
MNFKENIRLAWEGIRSGKMRAFLTMLGIIIGIASVIGILTLGDGLTGSINDQMSTLGATNIYIMLQSKSTEREGGMRAYEESDLITDEMIADLRSRYDSSIDYVSLSVSLASGTAKDGDLYANVSVSGINEEYFAANDIDLLRGRQINAEDIDSNRMNAVVSDKLVGKMFGGDEQAALGSEIVVYTSFEIYTFRIVGVYEYEQTIMNLSMSADEDVQTDVYIPLSTAKKLAGADDCYASITIVANPNIDSANFATVATNYLNKYYADNPNFQVSSMSMESMLSTVDSMMNTVNIAIAVIAGISLLVGGIGVMNIMLVSVTERTREIGTRKAIGATNGNIRIQFVTESVIICLIGGAIGIIMGTLLGYFGSKLLGFVAFPSLSHIALAVSFSMAIGIFFGYYPANKAAKLDPIEALRYE